MATPLATAPTTQPAGVHGMCLLHADYHPMDGDCWAATASFYFDHDHLTEQQARDLYALTVEQAMLDAHIRQHRTHSGS